MNFYKQSTPMWQESGIEQKRARLRDHYLFYLEDFIDQGLCKDVKYLEKYKNMKKMLMGEIKTNFPLLLSAEGILQKIKLQILHERKRQEEINRLNNQSIIELIETDDETEREPKEESSEDEIVYRAPSPICVTDLKKKKPVETINLDSDESDCEVVERDARDDIIEIRESPEKKFSDVEESDNESSDSSNSDSSRRSLALPPEPALIVPVPEKPSESLPTSNILSALNEDFSEDSNDTVEFPTTSASTPPKTTQDLIKTFAAEQRKQISDSLPAPEEDEVENDMEPVEEPSRPKPGIMGKRRKSVCEVESLSTYKLKQTALRPASSYAKPKNASNNYRKTLSVKEKPVEKPKIYNPLDEVIAINKVKERLYKQTYLDPNNKIKLAAAGKLPINHEEAGSLPKENERVSIKEKLFNYRSKKNYTYAKETEKNLIESKDKKKKYSKEKSDKKRRSGEKSKRGRKRSRIDSLKSQVCDSDSEKETDEKIQEKPRKKRKSLKKSSTVTREKESSIEKNSTTSESVECREPPEISLESKSEELIEVPRSRHLSNKKLSSTESESEKSPSPATSSEEPKSSDETKSSEPSPEEEPKSPETPPDEQNSSEAPTTPKSLDSIKYYLEKFVENYLNDQTTSEGMELAKKLFGEDKFNSLLEDLEKQKQQAQMISKIENKENEKNLDDEPATEIEEMMEELHKSPVKTSKINKARRPEVDNVAAIGSKSLAPPARGRGRPRKSTSVSSPGKKEAASKNLIVQSNDEGTSNYSNEEKVMTNKQLESNGEVEDANKELETQVEEGVTSKPSEPCEKLSNNQSSAVESNTTIRDSFYSDSGTTFVDDNDPENLLEPLPGKVRRPIIRRKSMYVDNTDVPSSKRRKSADTRVTRNNRKRNSESINFSDIVVKTEPVEEDDTLKSKFPNIIGKYTQKST